MREMPDSQEVAFLVEDIQRKLTNILDTCDVGRYMGPGASVPIEYITKTRGPLTDTQKAALEIVLQGNGATDTQKADIHAAIFGGIMSQPKLDGSGWTIKTNVGVILEKSASPGTPGSDLRLVHIVGGRQHTGRVA